MTAALEGGASGQQHAPAILYSRERPGTHYTGGWVGPRAGLDGRKISPHRDSIPGPSSPQSVAMPTELPGPHLRADKGKNLWEDEEEEVSSYWSDFRTREGIVEIERRSTRWPSVLNGMNE